ncbi:MAG: DUF2339 domain-containing protein [Desulfobulbaceae bacterium]|jgi:uncharacterized membrane protein|nr:DUF2339 domain-containing protein [Desulfobulbaceae bacterium]
MDGLIPIGILAALFYVIIMPILTFIALSRGNILRKELEDLQRHLTVIAERLTTLERLQAWRQGSEHTGTEERTTEQGQQGQPESREKEFSAPTAAEAPPSPEQPTTDQAFVFTGSPSGPKHPSFSPLEVEDISNSMPELPTVFTPPLAAPRPTPAAETAQASHAVQAPKTPPAAPEAMPTATDRKWLERFFAWCIGGNPMVRVGILILFFGVSFLLKLVVNHGLFPLELRLSCVALGAAALLGIGWRLRDKRRNYGLLLQGGGVGILYLVIYATFAYFKLIPPAYAPLAFLLLFAVCALSAFLAVRQDASALAVMGMTGGFAAPVLISTGSGNHIALFSYFALLNAGVLGIAWFRAWRPLNLLGFVFTLGVGSAWGMKYYTPAHLPSVEFFLVLFFLYYVSVALLYAIRRQVELKRYVDGALVFGAPIAFSLLQTQLVSKIEFGMAWSALALGAFYLLLAAWLARYRLERLRLLFEAMLALSVLFLTLAVPLAFEGTRLTAAIWAVEGAGLCWVAVRQRRILALASGLALQIFAAVSFFFDRTGGIPPGAPLALNSWYLGALMLSLSAFFCGWRLHGEAASSWPGLMGKFVPPLSLVFTGIGLLWWLGGGYMEILRYFGPFASNAYAYLLFAVLTAWLAHGASRFLRWTVIEWVALALSPALLLVAALSFVFGSQPPLAAWGLYAWPLAAVLAYALLFQQEHHSSQRFSSVEILGPPHALIFWTLCLVAGLQFHSFVATHVPEGVWRWSSWAFSGTLLLLALIHIAPRFPWPVGRFRAHYLTIGAAPVALLALGWAFLGLASDGNPAPLPYVPLLNPVELCQLLVFAALFSWKRANEKFFGKLSLVNIGAFSTWLMIGIAALLFLLLNTALLRTLHQYTALDYQVRAVFAKPDAQLYFVALWVIFATATSMLLLRRVDASRRHVFFAIILALLSLLWAWSVFSNVSTTSGKWGAIPLFNPFDLAQVGIIALSFFVLFWLRPMDGKLTSSLPAFIIVAGCGCFLWLNAMLLRALHHWLDIPYLFDALYASTTAQAALSLLWGFLALILMLWAVRRAQRLPWFAGITLLVLTVGKLFFVELAHIGGVARTISFIGVGVLLLLIGYLAPLPPKKKELV